MKKPIAGFLLSAGLAVFIAPAHAANLIDVYKQALHSDPVLQAAQADRLANKEALPQSVSGLLPSLSAVANTTGNRVNTLSVSGSSVGTTSTGTTEYNSNGYTVTLSQPLISAANWMQVKAASATSKQADATLGAAEQDLIIRTSQAYFAVLLARDNLAYVGSQQAANAKQFDQAKQRYDVGLDAITSVYDTQAAYDASLAAEIAAENTLSDSIEALRQLTGQTYTNTDIEGLKVELPLLRPDPEDVELWVAAADKQNLNLLAQRFAVQSARAQVKVNFAGHIPTVSAVGTYGRSNGQSLGTVNSVQATVGLQVSVPLFQGGLVTSQTRQAEDEYAAAAANMENIYRQTEVTTRQKYNDVMAGISQIKADRQAIVSAQNSVDTTEEAYKVGTRTIVDVLTAQQNLYQAKKNYASDEYSYLQNTLLLKQAAGTLSPNDLSAINRWIGPTPRRRPDATTQEPITETHKKADPHELSVIQVSNKASPAKTTVAHTHIVVDTHDIEMA